MSNTLTTSDQKIWDEGTELFVSRTFDGPQELVFQMFSPEHIAKWWAPLPWKVVDSVADFRTGGRWHYAMQGPDGEKHYAIQNYLEVTPSSRIGYEDAFADAEGNINDSLPVAIGTIDFVAKGDKTEVVMKTTYASEEGLKTVLAMGMAEGLTIALNQLDEVIASVKG